MTTAEIIMTVFYCICTGCLTLTIGYFIGINRGYKQGRKDVIDLDQKTKPTQSGPEIDTCGNCMQIKEIWDDNLCADCHPFNFKTKTNDNTRD